MDFLDWPDQLDDDYELTHYLDSIVEFDVLSPELDFLSTPQASKSLLDLEPGQESEQEVPKAKKKLTWTECQDEILERVCAENPGKGWDFACTFFPQFSKTEVKKRFRALRKANKAKNLPPLSLLTAMAASQAANKKDEARTSTALSIPNKAECLQELKSRLFSMEKDLLSSCSKIKDLIKHRISKN